MNHPTADNSQLDSGSSSTENLIESLSNSTCPPHSIVQITSSSNKHNFEHNLMQGNKATVLKTAELWGQKGEALLILSSQPIKCYNCNILGHIVRECPRPKRLQDSDYFKGKMLLMQVQENGVVLDEEQSLFLAGEQIINFDEDVDNSPENDLALIYMFMHKFTSKSRIYDEVGPSYDSNTLFEDFPDCEDSRARSIHKSFTSSASFWESSIQI
ncbi:retrovirus-related pol polyprotein from transposon TNT 1-94 [Tanacetum coccineum]|uniref:Retrovirus-related pol polyprotein from transposon TNT 1-94 n=1 Tax=Tanacetum coccineum TaxID=301880 RepID=A0ABQ5GTU7_9ASTR